MGQTLDYQAAQDEDLITPAQRLNAIAMIILATIPVLVVGFLTHDWIEANMENDRNIGWAVLIGGVVMIAVESIPTNVTTRRIERISWKQALVIGLAQILAAVFPGTSRSAATITSGMDSGPLAPRGGGIELLPRHPGHVRGLRVQPAQVDPQRGVPRWTRCCCS